MIKRNIYLFILFIFCVSKSQNIIFSDPSNLFFNYDTLSSLAFRPIINQTSKGFSIKPNIHYSYSTSPNFDNVGNKYSLKGNNYYYGIKYEYIGKNILLLLEPYTISKENIKFKQGGRGGRYTYTNEVSNYTVRPYRDFGLRESLLFLHYKYVGLGISNMNHWLGPGIHNTLTMTNNAKGFEHYFIGTLKEKKITKNIGFDSRYIFSKINDRADGVYLTNLALSLTIHGKVLYRFGIIRDFLSGGILTDDNEAIKESDAMALVWGPLFADSKKNSKYTTDWGFEPWDQIITGFMEIILDKHTHLYLEIGTGDHRKNFTDLLAHWDHNLAYVVGFRKYLKNNKYLFGGEYTSLTGNSNTRKFRGSGPWYDDWWYDYSSYEGRHWAAHSGADSDEFVAFIGKRSARSIFLVFFNRERKGIYLEKNIEIKHELSIQYIRELNSKFKLIINLEREYHQNYSFIENEFINNYAISFGAEYNFIKYRKN
ncbi:hypothetical protein OAQ57_01765 [Candidatus Marinimicrobia bacterium]|nr:hypothetical protein [Candidatus Neomarinimicrobiota bacterium]